MELAAVCPAPIGLHEWPRSRTHSVGLVRTIVDPCLQSESPADLEQLG